jgi:hypothetical protein
MPKINEPVTYIKAIVESATPDRTSYKSYATTLTFDHKLIIEIPVPRAEIEEKGDTIILTLAGWTALLNNYTSAVENMNREHNNQYR